MAIEIHGAPRVAEEPEFGAFVVRVPLNETPSADWLQHFRTLRLPGHAHRAVEDSLTFYLDRNDQDVARVMRGIAAAVEKANLMAERSAEDDEKAAIKWASAMKSKREKIDKKLDEWWGEHEKKRAEALPSA